MSKVIRRMAQVRPAGDDTDGESEDDAIDNNQPVIAGEGVGENAKVAPPKDMAAVPGYPNVRFDSSLLPPPPTPVPKAVDYKQPEFTEVPVISEDTARTALLEYIDTQCCWGKGTANKLQFIKLASSTSYHYILETFTESRATKWESDPFKGQPIDGPQNGQAPGPWDIISNPCDMFQDEIRKLEVPHTASVKPCHRCNASGYLICSSCAGRGNKRCGSCGGCGRRSRRVRTKKGGYRTVRSRCGRCGGDGRRTCYRCHGSGRVVCGTCDGSTQVKWFIELTITWKNNTGHHIVEKTDLPDELIHDVAGTLGFQDTQVRVLPISMFPEPEINEASRRLLSQHVYQDKKILIQRHVIRMVPVTQCDYTHDKQNLNYFVYGLDCKVHAPTYPDQCCWGCTIL